jgi:hypothetical protein
MNEAGSTGKILILIGALLILVGVIFILSNRIPFIGKLPGDFVFKKGNFSFYFPLMTSIVISIVLTVILYLINKFRH